LVFPEATLNRHWSIVDPRKVAITVPSPDDYVVTCNNEKYSHVSFHYISFNAKMICNLAQILRNISCAAIEANFYIVVNVAESANCTEIHDNCDEEIILFNTNVVFDRYGAIVSR
jgi:hypothetical protein